MKPLLIVDGYNVIGSYEADGMTEGILHEKRDRLRLQLEDYAGYTDTEIILVFDGYLSDRGFVTEEKYDKLTVVFTKKGETADSYIERLTAGAPKYREIRVATSDNLEQSQIFSSGAIRMSSKELIRLLDKTRSEGLYAHSNPSSNAKRNSIGQRVSENVYRELEKIRRS